MRDATQWASVHATWPRACQREAHAVSPRARQLVRRKLSQGMPLHKSLRAVGASSTWNIRSARLHRGDSQAVDQLDWQGSHLSEGPFGPGDHMRRRRHVKGGAV